MTPKIPNIAPLLYQYP